MRQLTREQGAAVADEPDVPVDCVVVEPSLLELDASDEEELEEDGFDGVVESAFGAGDAALEQSELDGGGAHGGASDAVQLQE